MNILKNSNLKNSENSTGNNGLFSSNIFDNSTANHGFLNMNISDNSLTTGNHGFLNMNLSDNSTAYHGFLNMNISDKSTANHGFLNMNISENSTANHGFLKMNISDNSTGNNGLFKLNISNNFPGNLRSFQMINSNSQTSILNNELFNMNISENSTSADGFLKPNMSVNATAINGFFNASVLDYVLWLFPIYLVMALFGNILILIVMSNANNNRSSSSLLFRALAVTDIILTILGFKDIWLHKMIGFVLFGDIKLITQITSIIRISFRHLSMWILVCITAERVLHLAVPLKSKFICSMRNSAFVLILLCCVIPSYNTVLVLLVADVGFKEGVLVIRETIPNGITVMAATEFTTGFFVPAGLISIGSVVILHYMIRKKNTGSESSNNARIRSVTRIMITANIVCLVTSTPIRIFNLLRGHLVSSGISPEMFNLIRQTFISLADVNAVLNFYFYFLTGSKFRSDVKKLFGCNKCRQ